MLPSRSRATAPTVSCEMAGANRSLPWVGSLRLIFAQALDFAGDDEIFVAAESDAVLGGKALGAFGDKINVRAVAENFAGGADRVAQALDAADAAAAQGRAVHDERVELHFAVAVEETAASGVESFIVFENDHGFFNRVERRAAAFEHAPSGGGGVAHAVEVRLDHVVGNGPGAAVYDQNGIGWHFQSLREVAGNSLAGCRESMMRRSAIRIRASL